jgi:hypothetical protein
MKPKLDAKHPPLEDPYFWHPIDPPPCKDPIDFDPPITTLACGEEGNDCGLTSDDMPLDPLDSLFL